MSHRVRHEVITRKLKVQKVIGEKTITDTIESEVTLPVTAIKIFDIHATLNEVRGEVKDGGVRVSGFVHKQVFFVDEGDLVRHVAEDVPFTVFVEIEGAEPNMKVQVRAQIVDIAKKLISRNVVRQDIILELFVKVTETKQLDVVVDIIPETGLVITKKKLRVESVVGEDRKFESITKTVKLPMRAKKVYQIVSMVKDVNYEVKRNTVLVTGVVHKQIFFVDEGDLVRHFMEDVPFSVAVDVPGAMPNMEAQVDVEARIEKFSLKPCHPKDPCCDKDPHHDTKPCHPHHHPHPPYIPSNLLEQVIILDVFVKVVDPLQLMIVTNVEGPGVIVERLKLKVDSVFTDVKKTTTVESEVILPMEALKVFEIMASIKNIETTVSRDTVTINAVLHKQVFYVDMGNLMRHHREDIPFTIAVHVPGATPDMTAYVKLHLVDKIQYQLVHKRKLKQTAVIKAEIKLVRMEQLEVVVAVRFTTVPVTPPDCPTQPTTYTVQTGDTMFTIARKFGVTLNQLIQANPQIKDPDKLTVGQVINIPVCVPKG